MMSWFFACWIFLDCILDIFNIILQDNPVTVPWRILICCGGGWFTRQFSYYAETWSSVLSSMDRVPMSAELSKPLPCCFWSIPHPDSSGPSRQRVSVHTYNWEALIFSFLHAAVFCIVSDSQGSLFLFLWLGNWFVLLLGASVTCTDAVLHNGGCPWSRQESLFLFLWLARQAFSIKFTAYT